MLTNSQMIAGRYRRWAEARKMYNAIAEHLRAGGVIRISTRLRSIIYHPKHIEMFRVDKTGVYVQRGKNWDCINFCKIDFGRYN